MNAPAMQVEILTIFPGYFESPLRESLLGKAIAEGILRVTVTDLRAFALDRHRKVDDEPYGGGAGMVMMAPVVAAAIEARRDAEGSRAWTVLMSPDGVRLDHAGAAALALRPRVLIVCGRYEGIDERVRDLGLFDQEISLGDFVLPGGEAAALALTECVTRLVPGVVGAAESLENESFFRDRLDYPALHPPARVPGRRGPRGASLRATTGRSSGGAGPGRSSARAPVGRTCCERRPVEPGEGEEG